MVGRQRFFYPVILLLACLGLAGCQPDVPDRSDIEKAIVAQLRPDTKLDTFDFKVFPIGQTAQGRISVAGTLVTTEPRLQPESHTYDRIAAEARSKGVTDEQFWRFANQVGLKQNVFDLFTTYDVVMPAGAAIPFDGEFRYSEVVDGYRIDGGISYEICCIPMSQLDQRALINGSEAATGYVEQILKWRDHEAKVLPDAVRRLFEPLQSGAALMDGRRPLARIEAVDPASGTWSVEQITLNNGTHQLYSARLPTTFTSVAPETFSVAWSQVRSGQSYPSDLILSVGYFGPTEQTACVRLILGGGGTSGYFACWNGQEFGSPNIFGSAIRDENAGRDLSILPGLPPAPTKAGTAEAVAPAASDPGLTGEWFSPDYNYAFVIKGNQGICTLGNSPMVRVGEPIFRFELLPDGTLQGEHILTNGAWLPASGRREGDRLYLKVGVINWTMTRR
ncbi:MAG: hypothetical protein KDE08_09285 [Rhodobacteraceae bacterium]|nr:hypothetical protein [Paracoccaceae bacterium]